MKFAVVCLLVASAQAKAGDACDSTGVDLTKMCGDGESCSLATATLNKCVDTASCDPTAAKCSLFGNKCDPTALDQTTACGTKDDKFSCGDAGATANKCIATAACGTGDGKASCSSSGNACDATDLINKGCASGYRCLMAPEADKNKCVMTA